MPAEKRTGWRRCCVQYSTEVASASEIQVPVTFEMNGIDGALRVTLATAAPNASSAGSIIAEWNACDVSSLRTSAPRADIRVSNADTSASATATTQSAGQFTAASERPVLASSGVRSA